MPLQDQVLRYVRFNEGVRRTRYFDSLGIPTVGVGFNLQRADARQKIVALGYDYDAVLDGSQSLSDAAVDSLLADDVEAAFASAARLVANFDALNDARQAVVVDMIFNLGAASFMRFTGTIAAIEAADFARAAAQMADSKWARQVGGRARRNIDAMASGVLRVAAIDAAGDLVLGGEPEVVAADGGG